MNFETFMLFISIGIGGLLLLAAVFYFLRSNEGMDERIRNYALYDSLSIPDSSQARGININRVRIRINTGLGSLYSDARNQQLVSANWRITATEFILIKYGGTVFITLLSWPLFGNLLPGVGLGIFAYILPGLYLRRSLRNRRAKFQRQLVDVLVLMGGAVRAGYSLLQSLDVVVNEMASPASDEFRRVQREVELGLSLKQALRNLTERMVSDDLNLVVTAININSQVGGNLTTMLMAVTETIRERIRLLGEVRVLTSYARYSSSILTLLPVIVTALLFILNPTYIRRLFEVGPILIIPIGAAIGVFLGNIWIRRLSRIEV
jgi:tight adherence protein B